MEFEYMSFLKEVFWILKETQELSIYRWASPIFCRRVESVKGVC